MGKLIRIDSQTDYSKQSVRLFLYVILFWHMENPVTTPTTSPHNLPWGYMENQYKGQLTTSTHATKNHNIQLK